MSSRTRRSWGVSTVRRDSASWSLRRRSNSSWVSTGSSRDMPWLTRRMSPEQVAAADLLEDVARRARHDGGEQGVVVGVRRQHQAADLGRSSTGSPGRPRSRCRRGGARRGWPRPARARGSAAGPAPPSRPLRRPPCRLRPRAACAGPSGPVRGRRGRTPESPSEPILPRPGRPSDAASASPSVAARHASSASILAVRAALRPDRRSRQAAPPGAGDPDPRRRAEPAGGAAPDHRGGPRPRRRPVRGAGRADRGRAGARPVPHRRPGHRGGAGHRPAPDGPGRARHADRRRQAACGWPTSPTARTASGSRPTIPP